MCAPVAPQQAPIPAATGLPGRPYAIRDKWAIGGDGNWDYLTLDPEARQLFIAHQTQVQVVDLSNGHIAGVVDGFGEAHQVVLDPDGRSGYVSDARENVIRTFNRGTFRVANQIDVPSSPRALVYEPATGLLIAFGSVPVAVARPPAPAGPGSPAPAHVPCTGGQWNVPVYQSVISLLDPREGVRLADLQVCGVLGAAQADGLGHVYFAITNQNVIGRLDLTALTALFQPDATGELRRLHGTRLDDGLIQLDLRMWTEFGPGAGRQTTAFHGLDLFGTPRNCQPTSLAVDGPHAQLFTGCTNQLLDVVNTRTGASVASMTIGPGVDTVAYDAGRSLIFTANGGGYGSVTIIQRSVTDTYQVIQNLPTMERARTMAVDPSTGLVYLVTDLHGVHLQNPPRRGIGTLRLTPVEGSFQVLVIGN